MKKVSLTASFATTLALLSGCSTLEGRDELQRPTCMVYTETGSANSTMEKKYDFTNKTVKGGGERRVKFKDLPPAEQQDKARITQLANAYCRADNQVMIALSAIEENGVMKCEADVGVIGKTIGESRSAYYNISENKFVEWRPLLDRQLSPQGSWEQVPVRWALAANDRPFDNARTTAAQKADKEYLASYLPAQCTAPKQKI